MYFFSKIKIASCKNILVSFFLNRRIKHSCGYPLTDQDPYFYEPKYNISLKNALMIHRKSMLICSV